MTAAEVRAALTRRWPDSEYLTIAEAPQDSSRQERKLDALVVSLWKSRGHELDGVEIKVSMGDWRRELADASKADWWWKHVHRFWLAVPADLAPKIRDDLPGTWGLLACSAEKAPKVVVKAPRRAPEPLPWGTTVGLLRAAADSGIQALHRAEERGRSRGFEEGKRAAEKTAGVGGNYAQQELERLREQIREFSEASGIDISNRWLDGDRLGRTVALLQKELRDPGHTFAAVNGAVVSLQRQIEHLTKTADTARSTAEMITRIAAGTAPVENADAA